MNDKCTTSQFNPQPLIAGLAQNDSGIEFFGIPETLEVKWLQNGRTRNFDQLPAKVFILLVNAYNSNKKAKEILSGRASSLKRRVELYTYYYYGGLDARPDLSDGKLQEPENYRHSLDCISLNFKQLKLNGLPLKPREITMIDLFAEDMKDEVVAEELGIARSTLNQHKQELFKKAGVMTKPALLVQAFRQKVAQYRSA